MSATKGERLVALGLNRELGMMMTFGFLILLTGVLWLSDHPWDEEGGVTLQMIASARSGQARASEHDGVSAPPRRNGKCESFELAGIVPPFMRSESEGVAVRREGLISADDSIYSSMEVDERPELIWMLFPESSAGDSSRNIMGEVVLDVIINQKGEVEEVGLAGEDSHGRYDSVQATLAAVKGAVFKPARRDNNNVRCRVEFRVKMTEG